jgi:hypothetical protein
MISTKRTAQLAKKWQRMAVLGRKRLTWRTAAKEVDKCCTSVASKGHCAVYTIDGARFEVPLACLETTVFAELLQMSKEELGFTGSDGRITTTTILMEAGVLALPRRAKQLPRCQGHG